MVSCSETNFLVNTYLANPYFVCYIHPQFASRRKNLHTDWLRSQDKHILPTGRVHVTRQTAHPPLKEPKLMETLPFWTTLNTIYHRETQNLHQNNYIRANMHDPK